MPDTIRVVTEHLQTTHGLFDNCKTHLLLFRFIVRIAIQRQSNYFVLMNCKRHRYCGMVLSAPGAWSARSNRCSSFYCLHVSRWLHRWDHLRACYSHSAENGDGIKRARTIWHTGNQLRRSPSVRAFVTTRAASGWLGTFVVHKTCCNPQFLRTAMCHVGIAVRKNAEYLKFSTIFCITRHCCHTTCTRGGTKSAPRAPLVHNCA